MRKAIVKNQADPSSAPSNKLGDSQLARLTTTADGTDDKSTLPSTVPSARNVNDQDDLQQKLTT